MVDTSTLRKILALHQYRQILHEERRNINQDLFKSEVGRQRMSLAVVHESVHFPRAPTLKRPDPCPIPMPYYLNLFHDSFAIYAGQIGLFTFYASPHTYCLAKAIPLLPMDHHRGPLLLQ